jgi:hypothetical protein
VKMDYSTYREVQQDFIGTNAATRGNKWESLQARVTPDEKCEIYVHCKQVIKLPYSVVTRLIWRRVISQYRSMPQVRHDEMAEMNQAADDVMMYIPVIRKQRNMA